MEHLKIEIKWGIAFAAMGLFWMWLEKLVGLHGDHIEWHAIYSSFFAISAIAVYVFGLLDKRKNYYDGVMTYKQGFITGLKITAIVTLLSPLTQYITSTLITPEYFPKAIEYAVAKGEMTQDAAENYFSLKNYLMQSLIGAAIMGILTSAIVAVFTKRKGSIR